MKVEVKNVLSDVKFFADTVSGIRFMNKDDSYFSSFPSIVDWASGDVVLEVRRLSSAEKVKERLAAYNIESAVVMLSARDVLGLQFSATANDDIISIVHSALSMRNLQTKNKALEAELAGLNQNVDQLVEQLPYVRHGAFSRGVNAMKNQVEVLKNIRQNQR